MANARSIIRLGLSAVITVPAAVLGCSLMYNFDGYDDGNGSGSGAGGVAFDAAGEVSGQAGAKSEAGGGSGAGGDSGAQAGSAGADGDSGAQAGSAGAGGSAGDAGCKLGEKLCQGQCVADNKPEFGCRAASCDPCNFQNADIKCDAISGECRVASCYLGYADCDKDAGPGCETHLDEDPENCGACGASCNRPNVMTVGCSAGACSFGSCQPWSLDCNLSMDDGCETNKTTEHCLDCTTPCSPGFSCVEIDPSKYGCGCKADADCSTDTAYLGFCSGNLCHCTLGDGGIQSCGLSLRCKSGGAGCEN